MKFRKATPTQIHTLNSICGVDVLEAFKGFEVDINEVSEDQVERYIQTLKEAEERRERQKLNQRMAEWLGVIQ